MKRIKESEAKRILHKFGFSVPGSILVSETEVRSVVDFSLESFRKPLEFMVKPETLTGGRGKSGYIRSAPTIREAVDLAKNMLGKEMLFSQSSVPEKIEGVLVEEKITFKKELYLSFIVDRNIAKPVIRVSPKGGVDIEEVGESKIKKIVLNPLFLEIGDYFDDYRTRSLVDFCGLGKEEAIKLGKLIKELYRFFGEEQLILLEINPLALTSDNEFVALDAKIAVDESVLPYSRLASIIESSPAEQGYIRFPGQGNVGLTAHGAGIGIIIIDSLYYSGVHPAGFVDINVGISITNRELTEIFKLVMADSRVKFIFGRFGLALIKKEEFINSLQRLKKESMLNLPIVLWLEGCDETTLKQVEQIEPKKLWVFNDFEEAMTKLIDLARVKGERR